MFLALIAFAICEHPTEEPLSDYCKACLSLCDQIPGFLNSTKTAKEMWNKITSFCGSLTSTESSVCHDIARQHIFILVANISSGCTPSSVCNVLNDCPITDTYFAWLKNIWNEKDALTQQANAAALKVTEFAKIVGDKGMRILEDVRAKVDEIVDNLEQSDDL